MSKRESTYKSYNNFGSEKVESDNRIGFNASNPAFKSSGNESRNEGGNENGGGNVLMVYSKDDLRSLILNTQRLIVYVYSDKCFPCKVAGPMYDNLSLNYKNSGVKFVKIHEKDNAQFLKVHGLPSFIMISEGAIVETVLGADKAELESKVQIFVSGTRPKYDVVHNKTMFGKSLRN